MKCASNNQHLNMEEVCTIYYFYVLYLVGIILSDRTLTECKMLSNISSSRDSFAPLTYSAMVVECGRGRLNVLCAWPGEIIIRQHHLPLIGIIHPCIID